MTATATAIIACWSISIAPEARRANPCTRCHAILSDGVQPSSGGVSPEPPRFTPARTRLRAAPPAGTARPPPRSRPNRPAAKARDRLSATATRPQRDHAATGSAPRAIATIHSDRRCRKIRSFARSPVPRRSHPWRTSGSPRRARRLGHRTAEFFRRRLGVEGIAGTPRRQVQHGGPARPYVVAKLATPAAAPPIRVPYLRRQLGQLPHAELRDEAQQGAGAQAAGKLRQRRPRPGPAQDSAVQHLALYDRHASAPATGGVSIAPPSRHHPRYATAPARRPARPPHVRLRRAMERRLGRCRLQRRPKRLDVVILRLQPIAFLVKSIGTKVTDPRPSAGKPPFAPQDCGSAPRLPIPLPAQGNG